MPAAVATPPEPMGSLDMRLLPYLALLMVTLAANGVAAQTPQRAVAVRVDTVPALPDPFLRARGDTLWYSVYGNPRAKSMDSTFVIVFHGADAAMLIRGRKVPLPPTMARIYRDLHAEALECPQPAVGCEWGSELMRKLGQR